MAVDNRLIVQWWRDRKVRDALVQPSNDELRNAVDAELEQDVRIDASEITATATDGHVVLRGSVGTLYEKQLATQSVMDVAGAMWISNLLAVRLERRDDKEIADEVVFSLQSDFLLRNQIVDVHVSDGAVTMSGKVNTANEKAHAADVVGRVRGVRTIHNTIEVVWTPRFRDAALETRVKTRLRANWETRWVADRIKVIVENGKVTLVGVVNTWAQWREAGRIAYLIDGVWTVDNQLAIDEIDYPWDKWYSDDQTVYYDAYPMLRLRLYERRF